MKKNLLYVVIATALLAGCGSHRRAVNYPTDVDMVHGIPSDTEPTTGA